MATLYGHPFSRTQRNIWMLGELGIPYDLVPVDFLKGEAQTPAFLAINPNGRVPAFVDDDGTTLFESLAINLYLSRRHGGALAAAGLVEESQAVQWSLWVANEVDVPLLLAAMNHHLFVPEERDPAEAEMALTKLARPFGVLDGLLRDRPYLLGDRFTVADVNVAGVMTLIPICGIPTAPFPHMTAWLHRCHERPAARAAWEKIDFKIARPSPAALAAMLL
ncbi:MAG TPA: glutathione S-transferase family protein [Sphingomonas sp.]|jgi:glutathione S-transferase|uniref:glutathione S-transferase family protein n=1 Tax=Sphingomonas sp. TaxID=28214 RepID=UPI002ED8990C